MHFRNALPSYLHHLALVNLSEVSSDGVHYLAGPSPATQLRVGGRGGGRDEARPQALLRPLASHPDQCVNIGE